MEHRYTALEKVCFEQTVVDSLSHELKKCNSQKVLLMVSNTLFSTTSVIQTVVNRLDFLQVEIFCGIREHTPRKDLMQAVVIANTLNIDTIVAIGGGSIIDAAKAVQFALNYAITSESQLLEYAQFADGSRGAQREALDKEHIKPTKSVRCIAVPTTLSGAEFSNTAGVLDSDSGNKEGYRAPDLYPQTIIYDPVLCQQTPEWLWLSTAIRSLDHAIEGFCSPKAYPYLEGQFLHAIKLFKESLFAVKTDPTHLAARALNQQAVWLACCGLGRVSHGASHGIGYILGSLCGVPHGYTSCVMLPAVLQWNAATNSDKQHAIAAALGDSNQEAYRQVKQLVSALGLPTSLTVVGVKLDQLATVAERAYRHPVVRSNPRPINNPEQVLEILHLAWE